MSTIKGIIFDLDGVLLDSRELHYIALNDALRVIDAKYVISREDHVRLYDGKPTKVKLNMLSERSGLPRDEHRLVNSVKQARTLELINEMTPDVRLGNMLAVLKFRGYKLAVASNSIRETVKMMLIRRGLLEYFDFFFSNEDVKNPKPHPEIYHRCMINWGFLPNEVMIVEDSMVGRNAAFNSGADLCEVEDYADTTLEKITMKLNALNSIDTQKPWDGGDVNILIPMAGAGSRFSIAGYTFPKPLIDVDGKPMIKLVVDNLNIKGNYIFIVQKSHYEKYFLQSLLNLIVPNCKIIQVDKLTEGACCTTLLAKEHIDNDKPLLIANSDQYIEWDSGEFMYTAGTNRSDGTILTFESTHPKWSYAELDSDGFVKRVAEKEPISNVATVGVYYWKRGSDYVKYAEQMIRNNTRVNNEFFVAPTYNEAIVDGKLIRCFNAKKMWGIGTPEDLNTFLTRK